MLAGSAAGGLVSCARAPAGDRHAVKDGMDRIALLMRVPSVLLCRAAVLRTSTLFIPRDNRPACTEAGKALLPLQK